MHHIIFFTTSMSEGEDNFELLISTQDYLRLQARCEELQKLHEKNKKQGRDFSTKIYDLKEQNQQLTQKNEVLNAQITKLKQANKEKEGNINGCNLELECLRNMLNVKEKEVIKLTQALEAKTKQMSSKFAGVLDKKSQAETKVLQISSQLQKLETQKKYLHSELENSGKKIKELSSQLAKTKLIVEKTDIQLFKFQDQKMELQSQINAQTGQLSNSVKLIKDLELQAQEKQLLIQNLKQQLKDAKEETARISHELEQEIQSTQAEKKSYIDEIAELRKCLQEQKAKANEKEKIISELRNQLTELNNQLRLLTRKYEELILETENQRYSFVERSEDIRNKSDQNEKIYKIELQKVKKTFEEKLTIKNVTISELQQEIIKISSEKATLQENLKGKLKQAEFCLAKQKETFLSLEKEYEKIITGMQEDKKSSKVGKENQKDQLKIVKSLLEEYFTNLALNLYEIGNLDQSDIRGILSQQEDIVKQYVSDIISSFVFNSKKPVTHRYPARP